MQKNVPDNERDMYLESPNPISQALHEADRPPSTARLYATQGP